jgi:hypothetical protein
MLAAELGYGSERRRKMPTNPVPQSFSSTLENILDGLENEFVFWNKDPENANSSKFTKLEAKKALVQLFAQEQQALLERVREIVESSRNEYEVREALAALEEEIKG